MEFWKMLYRSAWGMLLILVTVAIGCIFIPKHYENRALIGQRDDLKKQIAAEVEMRKSLQRKQERFQHDTRYIEFVAHEAGMVKPDEKLFLFNAESATPATPSVETAN